jgi:acetyl esterase/lipase
MQREASDGRVRIEDGVVFGHAAGRDLKCDMFHPPQAGTERVGVVLIHGGAWSQGDRAQLRSYGIRLARQGHVCAAIEYRLSGVAKWPAQIHDVKAGVRFMRKNSAELGIDPRKICVSGNSAGGHLALMVAATAGVADFEGESGHPGVGTEVAACVAFYPPTKLFGVHPLNAYAPELFERSADQEVGRKASPIAYARADFAPTLLLHGNRDALVPVEASVSMYQALADAGAPVELHLYNGAPHAFDATREFARHCADLMLLFLDRHVARPQDEVERWRALQAFTTGAGVRSAAR